MRVIRVAHTSTTSRLSHRVSTVATEVGGHVHGGSVLGGTGRVSDSGGGHVHGGSSHSWPSDIAHGWLDDSVHGWPSDIPHGWLDDSVHGWLDDSVHDEIAGGSCGGHSGGSSGGSGGGSGGSSSGGSGGGSNGGSGDGSDNLRCESAGDMLGTSSHSGRSSSDKLNLLGISDLVSELGLLRLSRTYRGDRVLLIFCLPR